MDKKNSSNPIQLDKLRETTRLKYEERIIFESPSKENCSGVLKDLTEQGALLITIERLRLQTEIAINIVLSIGDEKLDCCVTGRVNQLRRDMMQPLHGYEIQFNEENSPAVKQAIRDLVGSKKQPEASVEPPASSTVAAKPISENKTTTVKQKKEVLTAPKECAHPIKELADFTTSRIDHSSLPQVSQLFFVNRKLIWGLVGIVLIFLGIKAKVFFQLRSTSSSGIPVSQLRIQDGTVMGQVSGDWIQNTDPDQKRSQLVTLLTDLNAKGIHALILLNDQQKPVARVMINNPGNLGTARIELFGMNN